MPKWMVKPKLTNLAVSIELAASAGFGILFYFLIGSHDGASIIFGIGILLALATYLLQEELEGILVLMTEQYRRSHDVTFAISQIDDVECRNRARQLFDNVMKNVPLLRAGYIPLDETEFLVSAAQAVDATLRHVRSVNPLTPGWNTRAGFVRYYQANLRAIGRGISFTRIFVFPEKRLDDPMVQDILLTHYRDGFDVRIVLREELPPPTESSWTISCTFNFAIFDDSVVVDAKSGPGYYGIKTSRMDEVVRYMKIFSLIEHNARQAILRDGRIYPDREGGPSSFGRRIENGQ